MPDSLADFLFQLRYLFGTLTPANGIDILLVTGVFFVIFQALRQTRSSQMLNGIVIVLSVGAASFLILPLQTFRLLLGGLVLVSLISLPYLFQDELRRLFIRLSQQVIPGPSRDLPASEPVQAAIVQTATSLSGRMIGALIVMEGQTNLNEIVETGIPIQADKITAELLMNLFHPNTPMHDGAVVIRGGSLAAAGCILPVATENMEEGHLGTRHRAALGMSIQVPDALVVVVSEETGTISIARRGRLIRGLSEEQLWDALASFYGGLSRGPRSLWRVVKSVPIGISLQNLILSTFLAIFAWTAVTYQVNPPQRVILQDVPLMVIAPSANLIISNQIPGQVDLEIQTMLENSPRTNIDSVQATLNLSDLAAGVHSVDVEVQLGDPDSLLVSVSPAVVDVSLDELIEVEFPIVAEVLDRNTLPFGFSLGALTTEPETVLVRGPRNLVEQIAAARVELRVEGRNFSFEDVLRVRLVDDGEQSVLGLTPMPEEVLAMQVIERNAFTKDVPVQANLMPNLAEEYELTRIDIRPDLVTLVGPRSILENSPDFLETIPIDLSNVSSSLIIQTPLAVPTDTTVLDANGGIVLAVVVEITVRPVTDYLVLDLDLPVEFPSAFESVEISPSNVSVLLIGPRTLLAQVSANPDLISISVDLSGLGPGTHAVAVQVEAPQDLTIELFPAEVRAIIQ